MPQPTNRRTLGIFKETTRGTGGAPTDFIPFTKFDPKDVPIWLDDMDYRGSMIDSFDQQQGPIFSTVDVAGDVFPDTFGYFLSSMYGDVGFVLGSGAPNTWTFAPLNSGTGQPTSFCFTDAKPDQARRWAGQQCESLTWKWNAAGLLTYDAKLTGFKSSTTTQPSPSFGSEIIIPAWQLVTTIGGTVNATVEDAEVTMKRKLKVIHTGDGTADPYQIWVGDMEVTGKMTLVEEDETQLVNFLTNAKPSLDFNFTTGSGTAARTVQYHSTKTGFRTGETEGSQEYLRTPITFKAHGNATDVGASGGLSHSKWTVKNLKATGTY